MLQATFEPPFETMGALGREKGGTREVLDTGWLIQLREHRENCEYCCVFQSEGKQKGKTGSTTQLSADMCQ